jgi:hypothetical protein
MRLSSALRSAGPALLLLVVLALAGACGAQVGEGGVPTTTLAPYNTEGMCLQGQNVFREIDGFDRSKPDYLESVKRAVDPLDDRVPEALHDDMKAWVAYVKGATSVQQLAELPADLKVSTQRIDAWWKTNCGKPLINA